MTGSTGQIDLDSSIHLANHYKIRSGGGSGLLRALISSSFILHLSQTVVKMPEGLLDT